MKKIDILGIPVADTTKCEFVDHVLDEMRISEKPICIVTANPEIIMLAKENKNYEHCLLNSNYVVADGIGVVIGSKMLGTPLKERIPGYELVHDFMRKARKGQNRFFFYGGKPGIAKQAAEKAQAMYPNTEIVGVADGYGGNGDGDEVAKIAAALNPDFIFVATGAPKQEEWIAKHRGQFSNAVMMGVGGSLDVLSGNVDRAPEIFIKLNLEWFHRLITQPTRFKRMLKIPQFLIEVKKSKK
ncbi:WecB/TagA/CpsF family glycosyltransferase [Rummeliibacillus sp. NPDC094406]|uniref:WecB/TagA/CpsF family glycosyltransferase n=1 Tax=Rummeliibacillus sp. NPDC094406 TaxID=3364511 RepID=UPI003817C9A7